MSGRSINGALLKIGAAVTAGALMFGVMSPVALAQTETTTPPPTTETTVPPTTTEPPTSSVPVTTTTSPLPPTTTSPPSTTSTTSSPLPPTTTSPPTSSTVPPAPKPDLKVTATLDKASYASHEIAKATLTITNNGTVTAETVKRVWSIGLQIDEAQWGDLGVGKLGIRLAPGASHTFQVSGWISDFRNGQLDFWGQFAGQDDANWQDNYFSAKAGVTATRGSVGGLVYADKNRNDRFDGGEQIDGGVVTLYGGAPNESYQTTSNVDGRWSFPDLPSGQYSAWYQLPGGWIVRGQQQFFLEPGKPVDLSAGATRPYSESLTASMTLDKDSYTVGETATISVTLTNIGDRAINGIKAACNRIGDSNHLGEDPSWGPLRWDGTGVDLAVGQAKSLTVTEKVPQGAKIVGKVVVSCDFEPNPESGADGPRAYDEARVPGGFGSLSGTVTHDRNGNYQTDPGEEIALTPLVLVDQATGQQVASAKTDSEGKFALPANSVPAGFYRTLIVGPWRFAQSEGNVQIFDGSDMKASFFVIPAPQAPNLKVTAGFAKPSYDIQEQVTAKVTVTNLGNGLAKSTTFEPQGASGHLEYDLAQWGELHPRRGVDLEPGQSREVTLTGSAEFANQGTVWLKGRINTSGDIDESDNVVEATAEVTHKTGDAVVTVYGDRNENGSFDEGEALEGASVTLEGGVLHKWFDKTSDASGKVEFVDLPIGSYRMGFYSTDGWLRPGTEEMKLDVKVDETTTDVIRTVRPLSDKLPVSMKFDKPSYQAGERIGLNVTITNQTDGELHVTAHCGGYGWAYEIGNGPEWGDFAWDGPGARMKAGETISFHVQQDMPEASPDHGLVLASCVFGPPGEQGATYVRATTKVPGAVTDTSGRVVHGNGHKDVPVGDVPLVLLDPDTKKVVARTTTDKSGNFTFQNLPVGHYTPVVVGPWKVVSRHEGPLFAAIRGSKYPQLVYVEPGPEVADPGFPEQPTPPPAGGNTPPASVGTALAKTGASVLGLAVLGALLVAFGFGASAASRRKATV